MDQINEMNCKHPIKYYKSIIILWENIYDLKYIFDILLSEKKTKHQHEPQGKLMVIFISSLVFYL